MCDKVTADLVLYGAWERFLAQDCGILKEEKKLKKPEMVIFLGGSHQGGGRMKSWSEQKSELIKQTVGRLLAFHVADSGLISRIPYGP